MENIKRDNLLSILLRGMVKKKEVETSDNYKEIAARNKERIINKDVAKMKNACIKEFKKCIDKGIDTASVAFLMYATDDFLDEISERVLAELKEEHPTIDFSFCMTGYADQFKSIKMVAI